MRGPHPVSLVFGIALGVSVTLFAARFGVDWLAWLAGLGVFAMLVWAGIAKLSIAKPSGRGEGTTND